MKESNKVINYYCSITSVNIIPILESFPIKQELHLLFRIMALYFRAASYSNDHFHLMIEVFNFNPDKCFANKFNNRNYVFCEYTACLKSANFSINQSEKAIVAITLSFTLCKYSANAH